MPASASSTTTITTATTTTTTTLRGGSGLFLLLLWIEGLCSIGSIQSTHAYIILPQQKPLSLSPSRAFAPKTGSASARCVGAGADRYFGEDPADNNNNNNNSNSNSSNQDFSIEAAIGNAQHASEYERDAEFYRKRNEAYSKSLRTDDLVSLFSSTASSTSSSPADEVTESPSSSSSSSSSSSLSSADTHRHHHHHRHHHQQQSKASLLKASFDHIEASTYSLLTGRPLVALGIFCATGILVAYLSGFFFLEGYIENWNPAENDQVPYWEDAEIHTIQRVVE
eukprot:jgi/Psemu1/46054/gm1.46054_g